MISKKDASLSDSCTSDRCSFSQSGCVQPNRQYENSTTIRKKIPPRDWHIFRDGVSKYSSKPLLENNTDSNMVPREFRGCFKGGPPETWILTSVAKRKFSMLRTFGVHCQHAETIFFVISRCRLNSNILNEYLLRDA